MKIPAAPAKGILKRTPLHKKLSVRFDLPYVEASKDAAGLVEMMMKKEKDGEESNGDVDKSPKQQATKSSQHLGLELYQYYSTLCTRHGIKPWDKLLQQIKVPFPSTFFVFFLIDFLGRA